jgi:hypothetical protein
LGSAVESEQAAQAVEPEPPATKKKEDDCDDCKNKTCDNNEIHCACTYGYADMQVLVVGDYRDIDGAIRHPLGGGGRELGELGEEEVRRRGYFLL